MKKISLVILLLVTFAFSANAQGGNGYQNAVGVRAGWGAEASYQRYLDLNHRLEFGLGINRYGFDATGIFQWMFDIPSNTSGQFKWYAGAGVGTGGWYNKDYSGFSLGFKGQIGIEYTFKIPLLLSMDYRPGLYLLPSTTFDWSSFAVGVRYCF